VARPSPLRCSRALPAREPATNIVHTDIASTVATAIESTEAKTLAATITSASRLIASAEMTAE